MAGEKMLAAVLAVRRRPLEVAELPIPRPGRGEVLVKLEACGVCHSDVHIWQGAVTANAEANPFVMGHEGVGRVAAVGEAAGTWKVGDRAGVPWLHDACGVCDECVEGAESFCQSHRAHGLNVPGCFAEYVVADARFAVPLPDGVDPLHTAPVMCAGVTAFGALRKAGTRAGDTVAIFGCGGLGLYAVQIAARSGAKVVAVDRDPGKLAVARSYGAETALLYDDGFEKALGDLRAHACINFAPTVATWQGMVATIRPRGCILAAAMVSRPVPLNQEWLTAMGVTILGTSVGTRAEMRKTVAMHAERPLLSEIRSIGLDQLTGALEALADGRAAGQFVVDFRQGRDGGD